MAKQINRRQFAKIVSSTGLGSAALVDTMLAEVQEKGSLSRDTVNVLLKELTDLKLTEEEIDKVRSSFERSLESIRKVRAYQINQSQEPATVFLVRR